MLTFIQRSPQVSLPALLDKLSKLNPRVEFAQTYPDEIQGAFESSADALQAALYASREQEFWVGIGVGELRIPRFAGALGTVSTNDCTGDALEFSRLAVEAARTGAPARGIAVSAHDRAVADMASGLTRLLYRVCSDRGRMAGRRSTGSRGPRAAAGSCTGARHYHPSGQPHAHALALARRTGGTPGGTRPAQPVGYTIASGHIKVLLKC